MEHRIIWKDPGKYSTFPSVVLLSDGEAVVAFREAGSESAEAARRGQPEHQRPGAAILTIRSRDGGVTWDPASKALLWDGAGEYVVADPALTVLADGTLLARIALLRMVPRQERHRLRGRIIRHYAHLGLVGSACGNALFRSGNGGQTWEAPPTFIQAPTLEEAMSRDPIHELPDGSLLLSVYTGYPAAPDAAWIIRSWDGGKTWGDPSLIAGDPSGVPYRAGTSYNETSLVILEGGAAVALVRTDSAAAILGDKSYMCRGGDGVLSIAWTEDWGLSWTPPAATPLAGQPGHLLRLRSGRLLCTYGYRQEPFGVRACLSEDLGRTWVMEREAILRQDGGGWDLGYPSSVQLSDDRILTVYYFHTGDGVRHIVGTLWDEQEALSGRN